MSIKYSGYVKLFVVGSPKAVTEMNFYATYFIVKGYISEYLKVAT